jgi:hypothetical protein
METTSPQTDCYLILCHNRPWQVNALSSYLAEQGHYVFIHVDASSAIASEILTSERIRLVEPRIAVKWGSFSMISAEMSLIRAAMATGVRYRYVHLISGQCLPAAGRVKTEELLNAAYAEKQQIISCSTEPITKGWGRKGFLYRIAVWYPQCIVDRNSKWHRYFHKWKKLWRFTGLRRFSWKKFAPFHSGSQWWSLTGDCVQELLRYVDEHPDFYDFFRHTFCSDEMFVQSTLMHLTPKPFILDSNKRFMIWRRSMSPADLVEEEWPQVWSSNCLIARKFLREPGETERYLAALDAEF